MEELGPDAVDLTDFTSMEHDAGEHTREDQEESEEHSVLRADSGLTKSTENPGGHTERNVLFNSRPQMKSAEAFSVTKTSVSSYPRSHPNPDPEVAPGPGVEGIDLKLLEEGGDEEAEDGRLPSQDRGPMLPSGVRLVPVNSEPQKWAEELELEWTIELVRDDLLALRDFFKQGMDFHVVEQVVLGYPMENDDSSEKDKEKGGDAKDKKKDSPTKGKKGKESKANENDKKKKVDKKPEAAGGKDKKKKKEPEVELVKSAPTFTTIASFHITLEHFLEGEFDYRNVFSKGDVPPPSTIRSMDADDKKLDKKESKDRKKPSPEKKASKESRGKSPRGKASDTKGGKGKGHTEEAEDDELPPPPLELEVTVKLHHWLTAMDSIKEEEDRTSSNENNTSRTLQTVKSKDK